MSLLSDVRLDVEPRYRTRPARLRSAGQEAVELAASAGLVLDPWQQRVLDDGLSETADGRWAAFEVGLVVPRQNGKGSILEARELAGLFLFDEELIIHSAHEFKTAAEAFRRVLMLIEGSQDLSSRVLRVRSSHGDEGVELRSGQRLRFMARTGGSGRGFSGDCVILDEAYNLPDRALAALLPTMSAMPNPQIWYTSSAPLEGTESDVLRRLIKRGREGSASLAFSEFCAEHEAPHGDRKAWNQANPAMGYRITEDFIEKEREALDTDDFARERLGLWIDPEMGGSWVIPEELWNACGDDSDIPGTPVFALEVAEDRSWSAFAAAAADPDGIVHAQVVDYRPGTSWCVQRALELRNKWSAKIAVAKGSPAGSLVLEMQRAGIPVEELSTDDHVKACGRLFDAVNEGRFRHNRQPALDVSLRGAVKREVGDAWIWSRRKSTVDISPLVAVTFATYLAASVRPAKVVDLNAVWAEMNKEG
jgi:phage terminase large subunit-like protein